MVSVDDKEAFQLSLTENIQRKSMNPIEEARAFEAYTLNYGWVTELTPSLGKSISYVDRRMRLLELPSLGLISSGRMSASATDDQGPRSSAHLVEENRLSARRLHLISETRRNRTSQSTSDRYLERCSHSVWQTFRYDISGAIILPLSIKFRIIKLNCHLICMNGTRLYQPWPCSGN